MAFGCRVAMHGKVVGLDVLSRESAYRMFHTKLIKSYAIDAEMNRSHPTVEAATTSPRQFLERPVTSTESRFESPGRWSATVQLYTWPSSAWRSRTMRRNSLAFDGGVDFGNGRTMSLLPKASHNPRVAKN